MPIQFSPTLAAEYGRLWQSAVLRPRWVSEARSTAAAILAHRSRYDSIAADPRSRAPWWWIGCIHHMECGGRWDQHLANGNSLQRRTTDVPAGLPKEGKPPFTFEQGAIAALELKKVSEITDWSVEHALYQWERYNGFGYRTQHPDTLSPYLWSGTNHYASGKYVRDHVWSSSAVSGQIGIASILVALIEICPEIGIALPEGDIPPPPALNGYELKAVQTGLKTLGYYAGTPDGLPGRLTTQAIAGFRHDHGMDPGEWDAACRDALDVALQGGTTASVSDARAAATRADVAGNPVAAQAKSDKTNALVVGGTALAGFLKQAAGDGDPLDQVQHLSEKASQAWGFASPVVAWATAHPGATGCLAVAVLAGWWWVRAHGIEAAIVGLFRQGKAEG